jgi:hypothetical protein
VADGYEPIVPPRHERWIAFMQDTFAGRFRDDPVHRMRTLVPGPLLDLARRATGRFVPPPVGRLGWPVPPETDLPIEEIRQWREHLRWQVPTWYRRHWPSMPAFVLPTRTRTLVKSPFRDFGSLLLDPVAIGVRPSFVLAGYDPATFLNGMTVRREAWVEGARVGELLAAAAQHPAIDAIATPGQALWLHPIRRGGPGFQPAEHLLVVSGHVRYAANAQFDLAHFDQANFAVPTT